MSNDFYKIEDYTEQLKQLCVSCKRSKRCKKQDSICLLKKFAFNLAKVRLAKQNKSKELNEKSEVL